MALANLKYVDKNLFSSVYVTLKNGGSNTSLSSIIGAYQSSSNGIVREFFNGYIYDLQVFNGALDESDVKRVMLGMSPIDNS